jgi:hypothetical protein
MTRLKIQLWSAAGLVLVASAFTLVTVVHGDGGQASKIYACINPSTGIRIINPNDSCKSNETSLNWNIQGPPGPAGEIAKALTEISLVSGLPGFWTANSGELSHFLWEPGRYDPAPTEIFLLSLA